MSEETGILGHAYYMREALKLAKRAYEEDEVPVGAVLVQNGLIIAKAYNQTEMLSDTTAHAEILAITAASAALGSKFLDDTTLYVTLEPCLMCAGAIKWSRIAQLVIAASDPKEGYLSKYHITDALHPRTNVLQGILETEASALLSDFFQQKRKKSSR